MGSLTLNGATSGQITINPPAVAGTNTLTLPAATGTVLTTAGGQTVSGNTTVSGTVVMGSAFTMRNKIINGAMYIDQRNAGASITPTDGQYSVDRWKASLNVSSKFSLQQSTTAPAGHKNSLLATSLSAYTIGASEVTGVIQLIEGFNLCDLGWGTSSALTVTLSFWVRSSLTGTFGGSMRNSASNRSYPFSYSISAANTWEQKSITIPGDTTGTWLTDNGIGISLYFSFGSGSTYSATAGSWTAGNYVSSTGATSVVGTNGATFYITGVQLEIGTAATPFEYRNYQQELAMCQRYFYKTFSSSTAPAQNAGSTGAIMVVPAGGGAGWMVYNFAMPTPMRASPTVTTFNTSAANANWSNSAVASVESATDARINLNNSSGGTTGSTGYIHITASAEL